MKASCTVGVMANSIIVAHESTTAVLTLSRGKVNALSMQMLAELREVLAELAADPSVHALVVTGAGRCFAAGVDIQEMATMDADEMGRRVVEMHEVYHAFARFPRPTVAAINGYALGGGCELLCGADRRIASDQAVLGQPEVLLGVFPGAGGTQRLTALVGPALAKDLIFTGRQVEADEALRIGLVDEVVGADDLLPRALQWAAQFENAPMAALAAAKQAINQAVEVDERFDAEARSFAAQFGGADQRAGMESFLAHGPGKARFGQG